VIALIDQAIASAIRYAGPHARLRRVTLGGDAHAALIDEIRAQLTLRLAHAVDVVHDPDTGPLRVTAVEFQNAR
jgi:hypothetical protein